MTLQTRDTRVIFTGTTVPAISAECSETNIADIHRRDRDRMQKLRRCQL